MREIEVLTFNALGIRLGVDTTQVESVLEMEQASDREVPIADIHEIMRSVGSASDQSPKVLLIRHHPSSFGVIVDRLEAIEVVGLDRIQPMPALIEKSTRTNAIWGSIVDNDEVILLIDFHKLPR